MLSFFIFPCLFICPRLNVGHPFCKLGLNTDYVLGAVVCQEHSTLLCGPGPQGDRKQQT